MFEAIATGFVLGLIIGSTTIGAWTVGSLIGEGICRLLDRMTRKPCEIDRILGR